MGCFRFALLLLFSCCSPTSFAQQRLVEPIDDGASSTIKISAPPVSRALILCGLMGDAEHRKLYAETVERLYAGLTEHHGFAAENVALYWSDPVADEAGAALKASRGPATKEAIELAVSDLRQVLQADDRLWVFVLGHAHYDSRYSWLNIPGPDMQHVEFGKLFVELPGREQVFFLTTPVSGYYHKTLAAPGRIVMTATEPDLEVNETLFPHHLAKTLAEPPPFKELDVDEDGRPTLLDAYLYTCQKVAEEYLAGMLIATEHPQLDDTGSGRPVEIQADYLSEEQGGRLRAGRDKPVHRTGPGSRARSILLVWPPSPPSPPEEGAGQ
jgi:hypothetical protein